MARLPGFRRDFRFPWRTRTQIDRDLDAELQSHLEMRTQELIDGGMTPAAARREARRQFGDIADATRYCREVDHSAERKTRRTMRLDELRQDVRYAVRGLTKHPGFTAMALLTLAVGIGASTAIFSVVNGVLLRPLPYGEPDRIVQIWETDPEWFESDNPIRRMLANRLGFAYPTYAVWMEHARAFDAMAVYTGTMRVLVDRNRSEYAVGTAASAALFEVLAVPALVGRTFLPEEDALGATPVAVLSYGFWRRRYGGAADVLGARLTFGDTSYTIVGVMPDGFYFPEPEQQFWLTLNDEEKQRGWGQSYLDGIGRLRACAAAAGRGGRRHASDAAAAAGHRRAGPAGGVGQRRQPARRARDRQAARDRDPRGAGRRARPGRAATADREHATRAAGRWARLPGGHLEPPPAAADLAARDAAARQHRHRSDGARFHGPRVDAGRRAVRPGAVAGGDSAIDCRCLTGRDPLPPSADSARAAAARPSSSRR